MSSSSTHTNSPDTTVPVNTGNGASPETHNEIVQTGGVSPSIHSGSPSATDQPGDESGASTTHGEPILNGDVRRLIFELGMQPAIVKITPGPSNLVLDPLVIERVNSEGRSVVQQRHVLQWWTADRSKVVLADPANDVFLLWDLGLPAMKPSPAWPWPGMSSQALPIERVLDLRSGDDSRHRDLSLAPFSPLPHYYRQRNLPRPIRLERLPAIREYFQVRRRMPADWWLDGYQVLQPEVVGSPVRECGWAPATGPAYAAAAGYFAERGLVADAGVRWEVPDGAAQYGFLPAEAGDRSHANHVQCKPYIGLRGYSVGSRSVGGQWAGFRYWVETGKVEFSPLAYHEVKDVLGAAKNEGGWHSGRHPELVVKVTIVRPGEAAPSEHHHCWEEVRGPPQGPEACAAEPMNMQRIRCIWQLAHQNLDLAVYGEGQDLMYLRPGPRERGVGDDNTDGGAGGETEA